MSKYKYITKIAANIYFVKSSSNLRKISQKHIVIYKIFESFLRIKTSKTPSFFRSRLETHPPYLHTARLRASLRFAQRLADTLLMEDMLPSMLYCRYASKRIFLHCTLSLCFDPIFELKRLKAPVFL